MIRIAKRLLESVIVLEVIELICNCRRAIFRLGTPLGVVSCGLLKVNIGREQSLLPRAYMQGQWRVTTRKVLTCNRVGTIRVPFSCSVSLYV